MKRFLSICVFLNLLCMLTFISGANALDLGNGKFIIFGSVHKQEGKNGSYVITDFDDGEKEYMLKPASLKNYPPLLEALSQADKKNYQLRMTGVWGRSGQLDPAQLTVEMIRDEKDCPDKVFSTHTLTGTYMGTEWGDFGHVIIKQSNGKEISKIGDGEDLFGKRTGIKVEITYDVMQAWNPYGGGGCGIMEVVKSGKRIK